MLTSSVTQFTVPPIRNYLGDGPRPQIPLTYPSKSPPTDLALYNSDGEVRKGMTGGYFLCIANMTLGRDFPPKAALAANMFQSQSPRVPERFRRATTTRCESVQQKGDDKSKRIHHQLVPAFSGVYSLPARGQLHGDGNVHIRTYRITCQQEESQQFGQEVASRSGIQSSSLPAMEFDYDHGTNLPIPDSDPP